MPQDRRARFVSYLKNEHEGLIILPFFKKYNKTYGAGISEMPDSERLINIRDPYSSEVSYPSTNRDNFAINSGWPLYFKEKMTEEPIYVGNISIYFKYDITGLPHPELLGSSFKYWFVESKYHLIDKSGAKVEIPEIEELNFNIRFDKDKNHASEGLENHVTYLHTNPRVATRETSLKDFLAYVENTLIPMARRMQDEGCLHIGRLN